ncbi:MAG: methylenetetrahydrofolate--tRNA-(uracil(54)-C(5))-methyltransferase (FADH(2)-oxidizing) TrmFO [Acidobacteriota bacterium]|nr:MAG: methylenetetrahydrofolate--tRNA-(uracil(54)-C(5))-methyltransferase (FADH(2)-oxidizing) TrmFO [Acidobacteriota bacterium]
MARSRVIVVGGGLAGSEAAWQCACRGVPVSLFEMRPQTPTAVHRTDRLAELVCSNSFKSLETLNAHGLLKAELRLVGSLIIDCALDARLPAGAALAVDREAFAERVTTRITGHPLIELEREEVAEIPSAGPTILATGPLCSERLAESICGFTGQDNLAFYDAISPIIDGDTIDREVAFRASRYGKGSGDDYLNCPLNRSDYERFYDALECADAAELHDFDRQLLFEGCLPIEELARRGRDTLRFGPMKPVGLTDPRTGRRPWAVVQLRQDNLAATHWSMVGFQNRLRFAEQKRLFRMIPGLQRAEFVRLGMIHRNCYINSPRILRETFQTRRRDDLLFAGQLSGVEGYTESTASGMIAGIGAAALVKGHAPPVFPPQTALGSLQRYVAHANPENYQPTNFAFGLLPGLETPPKSKRERRKATAARAIRALGTYLKSVAFEPLAVDLRPRAAGL